MLVTALLGVLALEGALALPKNLFDRSLLPTSTGSSVGGFSSAASGTGAVAAVASGTASASAAVSSSSSTGNSTEASRYVAYWTTYANLGTTPSSDQLKGVTHVVLAAVDMSTADFTGFYTSSNGNFDSSTVGALKANAPGVKVMAAFGGWGVDDGFRTAAQAANIATFVSSCVSFVQQWGLDGVDLDWEYPGGNGENYKVPEGQPDYHPNDPTDLDNYINLLSALRTAFDQHGYILSATLPSRQADIDIGYPADKLQQMDPSVDFWNLMSYDHLNRRDNVTDFQAAMYTKYFQLAPGACTESDPIGCPMTIALENSVGGDTGNSGSLPFNSALNTNATEQAIWDTVSAVSGTDNSTALGSVYYDSTSAQFWTWVSPSDIQQTCLKWKGQVGGMMMWSLNQDTNGASGGPHIQAIADCLA
ncbi:hypothetical protein EHS25_006837 [Saitozyma podzolica]|uniref:GH18 domain-containing protein n=1 Tax=Saitozyma podzolica TaxID=1890683 RepID=A0A427XRM1_9TREE|nr:hypothetical protein EHS25_006837 [Saitozyma podzolica]